MKNKWYLGVVFWGAIGFLVGGIPGIIICVACWYGGRALRRHLDKNKQG